MNQVSYAEPRAGRQCEGGGERGVGREGGGMKGGELKRKRDGERRRKKARRRHGEDKDGWMGWEGRGVLRPTVASNYPSRD